MMQHTTAACKMQQQCNTACLPAARLPALVTQRTSSISSSSATTSTLPACAMHPIISSHDPPRPVQGRGGGQSQAGGGREPSGWVQAGGEYRQAFHGGQRRWQSQASHTQSTPSNHVEQSGDSAVTRNAAQLTHRPGLGAHNVDCPHLHPRLLPDLTPHRLLDALTLQAGEV